MILIKRTSAWDELSELVDRDEELETSSPYFKLYDAILESGKWDTLDNVVSDEFPNGVEQDELEDFFKDEQDYILDQLGITLSDDEYGYGDGEDEDNEDEYNDNSDD